ncbi:MAG: hypothetical protein AAFU71_06380 [Cyanobacteria bacterium J06632_22]
MTQPQSAKTLNWVVAAGFISVLTGMLAGFARVSIAFAAGDISVVTAARDFSVFGGAAAILCTAVALIAHWQGQSASTR